MMSLVRSFFEHQPTMIAAKKLVKFRANRAILPRFIFSKTGTWDNKFTSDTKHELESQWRDKVGKAAKKGLDKMYVLAMFPYPSGNLHMGHVRVYTIGDVLARYYTMKGKNVIYPIGWDSFGLPAENAALERGKDPQIWTDDNIKSMKQQLKDLNYCFDWDREISTCDPNYYKWTQYLFVKLFEKGLVYRKNAIVNWDPVDKTTLADEQVDSDGCSWRSGAKVEKKLLNQWFVRTTKYGKDLYCGLEGLQDCEDIVALQKGWIGDCTQGAIFNFEVKASSEIPVDHIDIWTDKPEFIFGASFIVLAKDHILAQYKELFAVNPFTKQKIPILEGEFEVAKSTMTYLGIPCANSVDLEFAKKFNLHYNTVFENGTVINSDQFSNLDFDTARNQICEYAIERNFGGQLASKTLRDWLISRQRYWGTPIPIIHCKSCGTVPVSEKDLPVTLPKLDKGHKQPEISVECPQCGASAIRETDTMDTFVDSSWYYLRYLDPNNKDQIASKDIADKMMPVDLYIGGLEHAIMHLYYARFMAHFMKKELNLGSSEPFLRMIVQGMVVNETYRVKKSGKYLPKDEVDLKKMCETKTELPVTVEWEKMSKSKFNGISPQEVTQQYGIDTSRLFILSGYGPTSRFKWPSPAFAGVIGWQEKLWFTIGTFRDSRNSPNLALDENREELCRDARNALVKNLNYHFAHTHQLNLVIKEMQAFTKVLRIDITRNKKCFGEDFERGLATLLICLAPLCPHFASELWCGIQDCMQYSDGYDPRMTVLEQKWPKIDEYFKLDLVLRENDDEVFRMKLDQESFNRLTREDALRLMEGNIPSHFGEASSVTYNHFPNYMAELKFKVAKPLFDKKSRKKNLRKQDMI